MMSRHELEKLGYSFRVAKRTWSLFFKPVWSVYVELIATGKKKRNGYNQAMLEARERAQAHMVLRRIRDGKIAMFDPREEAKQKLAAWFSDRTDALAYALLMNQKT